MFEVFMIQKLFEYLGIGIDEILAILRAFFEMLFT